MSQRSPHALRRSRLQAHHASKRLDSTRARTRARTTAGSSHLPRSPHAAAQYNTLERSTTPRRNMQARTLGLHVRLVGAAERSAHLYELAHSDAARSLAYASKQVGRPTHGTCALPLPRCTRGGFAPGGSAIVPNALCAALRTVGHRSVSRHAATQCNLSTAAAASLP